MVVVARRIVLVKSELQPKVQQHHQKDGEEEMETPGRPKEQESLGFMRQEELNRRGNVDRR